MPTTTGVATSFIDFTRASNATVTDSDGKVKWAPHNLLTNSESFDAASWTKGGGATVAANAVAAPNGTTTADQLKEATATDVFTAYQSITAAGATVTFSVFAKSAERTAIYLRLYNNTDVWEAAVFDLSAGSNSQNASGASTTFTGRTQAITPIGSTGWYLCSITAVFPSTAVFCNVHISNVASGITFTTLGNYSYAGNAANGVSLWGASLYRSDLGGMQPNTSAYPMYNPTTPKNLLGYTEDFTQGVGAGYGSIGVSNVATAPNGLMTADELRDDGTASNYHYMVRSVATVANSTYVLSGYFKANTSNYVILSVANFAGPSLYAGASFNLTSGTLASSGAVGTGYSIVGTPTITAVGSSGWYRCAVVVTAGTTAPTTFAVGLTNDGTFSNYGLKVYNGSGSGIFGWGIQVSDSASLDSYVPVYGAFVASAAYYGPRRDFDPVTLACKGLLVEELRTNLFLYSAAFDNAAWQKGGLKAFGSGSVANTTATASPTGAFDASFIQEDTSAGTHEIRRVSITVTSGISYTSSIYVKLTEPAGRTRVQFQYFDGTANAYPSFNISTGTLIGANGADATSIVPVGNGWYRISVTKTSASTSASVYLYMDNGSGTSYTGDGTSGLYIWGAQLEANAPFATSYIPVGSTSAGATRNADVASVSTQAFPYSASASSIVIALQHLTPTTASGTNHGHWILQLSGSAVVRQDRIDSSALIAFRGLSINADTGKTVGSSVAKIGTTFSTGDVALVVNGGTAYTSASATGSQSADTLTLGRSNIASAEYLNGHIRQITYLPRRISNAELITRTS